MDRARRSSRRGRARAAAGRARRLRRDCSNTLRRRELDDARRQASAETGLAHRPSAEGEHVAGDVPPAGHARLRPVRDDRRRAGLSARAVAPGARTAARPAGARRDVTRRQRRLEPRGEAGGSAFEWHRIAATVGFPHFSHRAASDGFFRPSSHSFPAIQGVAEITREGTSRWFGHVTPVGPSTTLHRRAAATVEQQDCAAARAISPVRAWYAYHRPRLCPPRPPRERRAGVGRVRRIRGSPAHSTALRSRTTVRERDAAIRLGRQECCRVGLRPPFLQLLGAPASRRTHDTKAHCSVGVRVSMLRPRSTWLSISAAAPIIRPLRKTLKVAVSRSFSFKAPDRYSFHRVASSRAAITASTLTQRKAKAAAA